MSVHNYYNEIQIKTGKLLLRNYKVGDSADLKDGVYIGRGGMVVVKDGIFLCELGSLFTKWGDELNTDIILDNNSMVNNAIKDYYTNHLDTGETKSG